jgi:hypothetical protein
MRRPIKIPTVIGILLVIAIVLAVSVVFEQLSRKMTTATGSVKPENVAVANVTDSSFTISWTTNLDATGAVIVSTNAWKSNVSYDERDLASDGNGHHLSSSITHSVTVRDLTSDTAYDVRILSNGKAFDGITPTKSVKTAPQITGNTSLLEPAYGTVLASNNAPANGALVYLTLEGGQMLSAVSNSQGAWLIPLNLARTSDLSAFLPPTDRITETILVRLGDQETTATADTLNDSPVPEMVMGKTYDFRKQQAQEPQESSLAYGTNPESQFPDVLGDEAKTDGSYSVTLTQPENGAAIPTALPLVAGTGIPGKTVAVTLGISQPFTGTTVVEANGLWNYTPTKTIPPGKQSVTITTVDATDRSVAITHVFEILKSGTQVLGEATPSGTLTPTPTGYTTPTPTLFIPTPTPTFVTTPVPTSTIAGEPVPETGDALPLIVIVASAVILMSVGAVMRLGWL